MERLKKQEFTIGFIRGLEFAVETAEKLAATCDAKERELGGYKLSPELEQVVADIRDLGNDESEV